jgi:SOS-response transcriptional repressor LexA
VTGRDDDEPWVSDEMVRLAGARRFPAVPDDIGDPVLARGHRQFLDWFTGVCRMHESDAARARTDAGVAPFLSRVAARLAELDAPVRRIDAPPTYRRPHAEGPVALTMNAAWAERAAPLIETGVAAGAGRALDEIPELWVDLPSDVGPGRYVALRVAGDSMEPLLAHGDVVLVELGVPATSGAVIVARNADDGYVVKRVERAASATDDTTLLTSINPAYQPLALTTRPGTVLGRVVLRWQVTGGAER